MRPTTSVPLSTLLVASHMFSVTRVYSCVVPRQASKNSSRTPCTLRVHALWACSTECSPPMTRTFADTQARKFRPTRTFADTQDRKLRPTRTLAKTRKVRCQASESPGIAENLPNNPYNIPPLVERVEATREKSDRWAAMLIVIASLLWAYRSQTQIATWFTTNIHKLDIPGYLNLVTWVAGVRMFLKKRLYQFWGKQQRRLACVDVIPFLATDVATLKQDVPTLKQDMAVVKADVAEIKDLLSRRPWFRF